MLNSKKSVILIILVTAFLVGSVWFLKTQFSNEESIPNNKIIQQSPIPTTSTGSNAYDASSYNPPKEFKYNKDTNLREVIDLINPQVLSSDFEELKKLGNSI